MANVSGEPPFSYLFYDAVTGALQGMLPLSAPKLSSILNAPGTWNGTVDLTDPKVQAMNPIGVTTPGRTIMCVDYNGALIYGGLVSTRKWSRKTRKLTLGGKELWEWFSLRNQWSDYQTVPTQPTGASMQYWTAATWDASMIAAQVVSDAHAHGLIDTVRAKGSLLLAEPRTLKVIWTPPLVASCTETVKALLNIHNPLILTPRQLHCALLKSGAESF